MRNVVMLHACIQGLGYGSGEGFDSLPARSDLITEPETKPSFQSMFVREGDVSNRRVITASESAAIARRREGDSALARRSAAAEVAKRLAEKAAEMKRERKLSSSQYAEDRHGAGHITAGRPRNRSREGCRDASSRGSSDRSRSRSRSRDRYSARDQVSRPIEGHRSVYNDNSSSRDRDKHSSGRHNRGENCQGVDAGSRSHDNASGRTRASDSHRTGGELGTESRKAPMARRVEIDYPRLVPGWDRMTPAAQLKARVRISLQCAGSSSLERDREEREEAIQEAEREGRLAAEEPTGARRPWTRFVFDRCAPLDEEGARPSLAFLDDRKGEAGFHDDDEAGVGRGGEGGRSADDVTGPGCEERTVNALSFRTSGQVAEQRRRDGDHDAAIFGTRSDQAGNAAACRSTDRPAPTRDQAFPPPVAPGSDDRVKTMPPSSLLALLSRKGGEDAPVVVTEEEISEAQARATRRESDPPPSSSRPTLPDAESEEIKERQKTMTWRERALLARAGKNT